jgi:hypothetical protein
MDVLVAVFFGAWALVSVLVLFPRIALFLRERDFFGLVPEWKFFAPIPGRGDFHLLYRDFYPEGNTGWTEIEVGGGRRWWNFVWHPHRRERKAAFDAARELARYTTPEYIDQIELSVPYLCFLCYVCGRERTLEPLETQFLLLYSEEGYAGGEPQVSLVSSTHPFRE